MTVVTMDHEGTALYLPGRSEVNLHMLTHWQLSLLAEMEGSIRNGATTEELRDFVTERKYSTTPVHWKVASVPGAAPPRSKGFVCSYSSSLYLLGGKASEKGNRPHLLECDQGHKWRPLQGLNNPVDATLGGFSGVVLKNTLYIIGSETVKAQAVVRMFDFLRRKWDSVPMPGCLSAGHSSFLAAHNQELILFGDKPCARRAQALTVVDDHAYVLVLKDESLHIHELDLQTWHWRRLPQRPVPFSMTAHDSIATALLQNRWWVVHGGSVEVDGDACCNQIHAFDFRGMYWCQSLLPPAHLGYSTGHMVTCHNGQMVIMGGERDDEVLDSVQRVWCEPATHDERRPPFRLRNCRWGGTPLCHLFPDATITAGGAEFPVHRSILSHQSAYFHEQFTSRMQEGRSSQLVIADMDADVLSLAIDWMYGGVNKPLELHEAAHMMRAGDRLGILDLRKESAWICRQWLKHMLSAKRVQPDQILQVKEALCCATETGTDEIALEASPLPPVEVCYDRKLRTANILRLSQQRFAAVGRGNMLGHVAGLEALLPDTSSRNSHSPVATHSQGSADLETSNSLQLASNTGTKPAEVSGSQCERGQVPATASIDISARCFDDANTNKSRYTSRAKTGNAAKTLFGCAPMPGTREGQALHRRCLPPQTLSQAPINGQHFQDPPNPSPPLFSTTPAPDKVALARVSATSRRDQQAVLYSLRQTDPTGTHSWNRTAQPQPGKAAEFMRRRSAARL
ncbi:BTB And C-terminal Kelch [Trebouxia sp. C0009 RCD-2024]